MAYTLKKFGDYRDRRSFSKSKNTMELADLLEIQKKSYNDFLLTGIKEVFEELFPVESFTGNVTIDFGDYSFDEPRYSIKEAKERMVNYAAPLKVQARVFVHETGEVKEQEIFLGDMPLMTDAGTFIINGAERVIVSQLVRSPSVYFKREIDKNGRRIISGEMIPNKGTWLEFELDARDICYVRIDRTRKVPVTTFLRALGLSNNEDIISVFGENEYLMNTFEKDSTKNSDEALIEIYKKLRPGELPTVDAARNLFDGLFYDNKRYDLAKVGRYKFNKKLHFKNRLKGQVLAEAVTFPDPETGEVLELQAGTELSREAAEKIQNAAVPYVWIQTEERNVKVLSSMMVDLSVWCPDIDPEEAGIREASRLTICLAYTGYLPSFASSHALIASIRFARAGSLLFISGRQSASTTNTAVISLIYSVLNPAWNTSVMIIR